MADLSYQERQTLERAFGMASGYVLDFTDRTFQEFVSDSVGRNIYDAAFAINGQSKAKHLRAFCKIEPNQVVGKLISDLVEHATINAASDSAIISELQKCSQIAKRLREGAPVLAHVSTESEEATFSALIKSVRQAIDENQPESGLDRLHTYFVSYLRQVCEANGIVVTRDEPGHNLLGKYVKFLKSSNRLESEMTVLILKYAQSTIDAFNNVRNNQSLAHPNPLLNYNEALLIFNHVICVANFIRAIEKKVEATAVSSPVVTNPDDIPF